MDRLSNLPITIPHGVLSRLPYKDAARTSILSKAWKETWSTFPILFFDETRYKKLIFRICQENPKPVEYYAMQTQKFLVSVDLTLKRFREKALVVKELKLKMGYSDHIYRIALLDTWMDPASEVSVEVLELELIIPASSLYEASRWGYYKSYESYDLPPSVLQFTSLVKLILSGPIRLDQAFLNYPIKFASLQVLSLTYVHLSDEQAIKNIISCCPLVEHIALKSCLGLNSINIHDLPRLKGIKFWGTAKIVVGAPNLEKFHHGATRVSSMPNVDKCKNLRGLKLENIRITIFETSHKFPLLEKLELVNCSMPKRLHLSSCQFKVLRLITCHNLKELQIDAPNLIFLEFGMHYDFLPAIAFLDRSRHLEVNVSIQIQHALHLQGSREFVANIQSRNVIASLAMSITDITEEWNVVAPRDVISMPPPLIEHLELQSPLFTQEDWYSPLIMALLCCCHPIIISMELSASDNIRFIKLWCKKLMRRLKGMNYCCCSFKSVNCWLGRCRGRIKYSLKDIKVKVTSSSRIDENTLDCKTFLDALPTLLPKKNISF